MKTKILRTLILVAAVWNSGLHAEIIVDPEVIKTLPKDAVTVRAQRSTIYQLGNFEEGEALGVEVNVLNEVYKDIRDRKSTRLNSSHPRLSRMPSSA